MSCNIPHFQSLLGAVKDTWAKPLIQGKYKNISWFGYTSCDEKHPEPMIDFEEHIIYVDVEDTLGNTYQKTQKAYEMIKDVVDFNYIVRTNTSIFVNINNLIKRLELLDITDVIGRQYKHYDKNGEFDFYQIVGFFFGMSKEHFEKCMCADEDFIHSIELNHLTTYDDDLIISAMFDKITNGNGSYFWIESTEDLIPVYKVFPEHLSEQDIEHLSFESKVKPISVEEINDCVVARVRYVSNVFNERTELGHEIEHMYELNDKLI